MSNLPAKQTKYAVLYALGPERMQQVDLMLLKGESCNSIARMICEDWGHYPEKEKAIAKQLTRYRSTELRTTMAALANGADPKSLMHLEEDVEAYERTKEIYERMNRHVQKYEDREQQLPIPMKATGTALTQLNRVNDSLLKLEKDTGKLKVTTQKHRDPFREKLSELEREAYEESLRGHLLAVEMQNHLRKAKNDCLAILLGDDCPPHLQAKTRDDVWQELSDDGALAKLEDSANALSQRTVHEDSNDELELQLARLRQDDRAA